MSEKLYHVPTEFEASKAIILARDAAINNGLYNRSTYNGVKHEMIGPAGGTNLYIRQQADRSAKIESRTVHEGRQGLRHISAETDLGGNLGQIEGQKVTLSKKEADGKWRELTSDNPVVVRLAETAIANQVRLAAESSSGDKLKLVA